MTYSHAIPPLWLRLAAHVIRQYTEGRVSRGCDDFDWPSWFPVPEREPLVRAMEVWNGSDAEEAEDSVSMYTTTESAPPVWYLAGFFAHLFDKAGGAA